MLVVLFFLDEEIGLHFSLSFDLEFVSLFKMKRVLGEFYNRFRDVNVVWNARRFHTGSNIDCITP